ncbi:membrane protein insertion efficiency factor YidD [Rickettsia sibirica]|uniref:membrane protein insertion efficiency factor YidD n=1 Tax=Rickettsia sibirica TaxID=35793 RepID=UPI000474CA18|nr:membrane protein insertion efficiency factor YidD [Rickettsia sibirica]
MTRILLLLLGFYQYFISPLLGNNCRFYPTCSEYAKEAISMHGSIKGLWFTFKRIIKCQPFCEGGYDTVPISIKNSKPLNKKI